MTHPKILVLAGSIRSGSVSTRLAGTITRELYLLDCEVTHISLEDYPLPIYNGDLEADQGISENALKLASLFDVHHGLFIVSPEYNGSLTPLLKNAIDWISRVHSIDGKSISPYAGKVGAIASASPGAGGGMSMLYHLREILVRLGVLVVSEQAAVGNAGSAFDENNCVVHERTAGLLKAACDSLVTKAYHLKTDDGS